MWTLQTHPIVTGFLVAFKFKQTNLQGSIQNIPDWCCKTIKLTIRPIGHHHPQSSSLLHVDTGPTVSSIFGMLPGIPFLSDCQALCDSAWSPQWYQTSILPASVVFLEIQRSHRVPNQGSTVGGDDCHLVFHQKLLGEDGSVRGGVVMVKKSGLFSPKFGATSSHVFTESPHNVAVEPGIQGLACWNQCFALPQLLYRCRHQSRIFWIQPRIRMDVGAVALSMT
jgi:hypothetical protein